MSARDGRMATNGHTGKESLRVTRVRGVPLAGEALGFGELAGGMRLAKASRALTARSRRIPEQRHPQRVVALPPGYVIRKREHPHNAAALRNVGIGESRK